MTKINPSYINSVINIANGCPYFTHLSMYISTLDIGVAEVEMDLDRIHLQAFGFTHGGAVASLIDTAAFWSAFCELDESHGITTVDLKINYLAPCRSGKLIAKGRRIKLGKKLGLGEASVFDREGKIIAHGTSTIIVVPGFGFYGDPDLPPKF